MFIELMTFSFRSYVRLGEHDTRTNPDCNLLYCAWESMEYKIKASYVYPKYNPRLQVNDIGLIRLADDISFNGNTYIKSVKFLSFLLNKFSTEFVNPICLPNDQEYAVTVDTLFTVAGWGKTETGNLAIMLLL